MAIQLTWHGHNCWSLDTGKHTLLIDPFLTDSPVAKAKHTDLKADFILLSHGHFDHVGDTVAIAKRTKAPVIANFEICEWLGKQGVEQTLPMNIGGAIATPFGRVKMTVAIHSSVLPDGTNGGAAGGFLLTFDEKKIYFACDTALFSDMRLIGAAGLDLAVIPIGDTFTMGIDDSIEAIKLLQPKRVAPCHFDTWPPIAQDAAAWAKRVKAETNADPIVLKVGDAVTI